MTKFFADCQLKEIRNRKAATIMDHLNSKDTEPTPVDQPSQLTTHRKTLTTI